MPNDKPMAEPKPPEGFIEICITNWGDEGFEGTANGARAELAKLLEDAQRWRRLRKRFFDKFGTPDAERELTPIDDSVLHRFLFSSWEDAEKWRDYCRQYDEPRKDDDDA